MNKINDYSESQSSANIYGKKIGTQIAKKYAMTRSACSSNKEDDKGLQTDMASTALSEVLCQCYLSEHGDGCGDLMMDWTLEKFWGKVVQSYIPKLQTIWEYLNKNKRTQKNSFCYGDIDGNIWIENVRQEDQRIVIVHKSNCSCANDRTTIFILDTSSCNFGTKLQISTVWDKEKKAYKKGDGFNDDRDISAPSLQTYQKRNFKYNNHNRIDKGYVLKLDIITEPIIKRAFDNQSKIQHVLWLIDFMLKITKDPEKYECN